MRRLKGSDYVLVEQYMVNKKRRNIYSITPKNLELISTILESKIDSNNYKSQAIYHESELQSSFDYLDNDNLSPLVDLRSDLILKVKSGSGDILLPLEYERVLKEYSRNVKNFEEYYSNHAVLEVLYLCESDSMIRSLMEVDKYVCQSEDSKIYFSHINQVKSQSNEITLKELMVTLWLLKKQNKKSLMSIHQL